VCRREELSAAVEEIRAPFLTEDRIAMSKAKVADEIANGS
jgi:hypothetical protein